MQIQYELSTQKMISIIKIGGAILENKKSLDKLLNLFEKIQGKKLLVHGGGRSASELMKKIGLTPKMLDGRRITDDKTLEIVSFCYAGLNKQLVAKLQSKGVNAVGLCGADFNCLKATKRPPKPIDYGWVGDVMKNDVMTENLLDLIQKDIVPVISPLTHDGNGNLLNTNADTIASVLAQALQEKENVRLIYAFEKIGLLKDIENENSLIRELNLVDFEKLKAENIIHSGMLPKLKNCFDAKKEGVKEVMICRWDEIVNRNHKTEIFI